MMHPINRAIKVCFLLSVLNAAFFIFPATSLAASTLQYSWNMDANPGWSTQGLWAWGVPMGGGGQYGNPDPTSGYTGTKVYGYNLLGDYENGIPEMHLTSLPIDCSGLSQVTLKFRRWLGVEEGLFEDHAYIRISNNGSTWSTAADDPAYWENPEDVAITENSWSLQVLNISNIADGQPKVYLRWTMGTTGAGVLGWQYCGWNIDDVEIWAVTSAPTTTTTTTTTSTTTTTTTTLPTTPTVTTGSATAATSNSATLNGTVNPNGASTSVVFNYGRTTGYGSTATAPQSPLSGTSARAVSAGISGLGQGLTYHYRVRATNSAGTTYGGDRTFTLTSTPCPDCSGPIVENVTFPANKNCECISSTSITMGTGITFETGANVTVKAPTVILKPGFRAPSNARLNIRQP